MNKGQTNILGMIIGLGAAALTMFGFYTAGNVRTDGKIDQVKMGISNVSERAAKLETVMPIIDKRLESMEKSLKNIEVYLRPLR